jgi:hypothetical protein
MTDNTNTYQALFDAPVAQWIEHLTSECAVVLTATLLDQSSTTGTEVVKAQPHLIPKGKGDNSMAVKGTVRG